VLTVAGLVALVFLARRSPVVLPAPPPPPPEDYRDPFVARAGASDETDRDDGVLTGASAVP
jgi:hypothetical protein